MVSQITLGNVTQQNGRTVISGSQSGIDTEGLIKALSDAKRLPAVKLETTNTNLATKKTALTDLKALLTRFKTATDTLRNPPGVQNASANIFQYRTATVSSVLGAANYLSATVQPGVNSQNMTVNSITYLAQETKQESGVLLAPDLNTPVVAANGDATAGTLSAGTFSLRGLNGGADSNITLTETDSLSQVAAKFNAVKGNTGIQATVVKVSSGTPDSSYKLVFTGTQTGLSGDFDMADAGTVTSDPDGVLSQLGFTTNQSAGNAEFQLDGVTITRETNVVTDLVDGVTFTLKQPYTSATPATISIVPDTEIVTNAINQMADVYNELRLFIAKQNEVGDDGLPTEEAVLASNPTLRNIATSITDQITSMVNSITGNNPKSLTEIGIGFQNYDGDSDNPATKNIIVIDATKLASALASNFDGVRNVFEFNLTSTNPNLSVYSRSNAVTASSFTLDVSITNGTYTVGGTDAFEGSDISAGVKLLTGKAGTPYEGLQFIYASTSDASMDINITQGIGDRLYNSLNSVLAVDGTLATDLAQIEEQTQRNETEITKIDASIETYRNQLLDTYSRLEAALTQANQLLSLLDAQASAREAS